MAKQKMFSKRLEKEFELEVCEPIEGQIVGDSTGIAIVRASALEELLFGELATVVNWHWSETSKGAVIVDISDDTGVHVAGVGDIDNRSLKNDVAKSFPVSTAFSRAIASAVVKYLGFEGRVYSDASFEINEIPKDNLIERVTTKAADISKINAAETVVSKPIAKTTTKAKEVATKPVEKPKASGDYPENVMFDQGRGKDMTLGEIMASWDKKRFPTDDGKGSPTGKQYLRYMYTKKKITGDLYIATGALLEKYPD